MWSVRTGERLLTFNEHEDYILSLVMTPEDLIISGSYDRTIKGILYKIRREDYSSNHFNQLVWDLKRVKCIKTLTGHVGYVKSLAINKDGDLYSSASDGTIRIWSIKRLEWIRTLPATTNYALALTVDPKQKRMFAAQFNGNIKSWIFF